MVSDNFIQSERSFAQWTAESSTGTPYSRLPEDEIDLVELFQVLWRGKKIIIATTFLFAIAAVIYSLMLPNMYRPEALIVPTGADEAGGLKGMLSGQLGGLANLAGVNISGGNNDATTALAILESRKFLEQFIARHDILVTLMATQWDPFSRELKIDEKMYDESSQRWVRDVPVGQDAKPSGWEAVNKFKEYLIISEDSDTNLVTIAFEWYDPAQAANWVNLLIEDLNAELRRHDRSEAQRAIAYLKKQLNQTHLVDMQQVFYQLIESQMKTVMLTDARRDYAFQVIDPAVEPEIKSKPKRSLICIVATVLGAIAGVFLVLLKHVVVEQAARLNSRSGLVRGNGKLS